MKIHRSPHAGAASARSLTILGLITCLLLGAMAVTIGCASRQHVSPKHAPTNHLDDFLLVNNIKLSDDLYARIAAAINQRESTYTGVYVPAGINKNGQVVKFDGTKDDADPLTKPAKPTDPGQMLTVNSNDPGFRDRSTAKVLMNLTPYLDDDLRRQAGPQGDQYADPVTYYRDFYRWKQAGRRDLPQPKPRVFMFLPPHFMLDLRHGNNQPSVGERSPAVVQSFGDIINLMLKVEAIPNREEKLEAMHHLISWLKGDKLTRVGPFEVTPVINDHTTGMGIFFTPAMMFPNISASDTCRADPIECTLPEPTFDVAIMDLMLKFTVIKTEYSNPFSAKFDVQNSETASQEFFDNTPSGVMYEALAYTDDPIILEREGLEPDPKREVNLKRNGRNQTGEAVFRGLTLSSILSTDRKEGDGRPMVNDHLQRPPSGVPLEEASFFLHASMMHAADGWGAGMWSSSPCMTSAMVQNYFGKPLPFDCAPPLPSPPSEGVRDKWNENAKRETAGCDESGLLPELELLVIPHMEIYDSHLYLPHGDLGALTKRYEEITIPNKEGNLLETPEQWAKVGYVAAKGSTAPDSIPRLLTFRECLERNPKDKCEPLFQSIFSAPYCGPLTRLRTSMLPAHSALPWKRGLPVSEDSVARVFDDRLSESVEDSVDWNDEDNSKDTEECRRTVDKVIIDCARCKYTDKTPIPNLPNGKSSVLGEQIVFLWIHLWPYGSMYTIHDGDEQFPRYWSTDGDNGGDYAGLLSFTHFRLNADCPDTIGDCYPDPKANHADWFTENKHKYFGDTVDRNEINRPARGDVMYQLRHYPQLLLKSKPGVVGSNLPNPTFPKEKDPCTCTTPP